MGNRELDFDSQEIRESRGRGRTRLMKRVTTFGYNMGLFSRKSEAEAQGFKTYGTFLFVVDMFMVGYDR